MFFSSDKIKRQAEDFKIELTDVLHEAHITQDTLGRELGVHQSTIAQWLNPETDNHMPAFELRNLPPQFFLPILKFILRDKMFFIEPIIQKSKPDGDISNELLKMTSEIGDMAKRKELNRENIKILKRRVVDLHELVHQIDAEIEAAESR